MRNDLISVVIPTYNSEKTLDQCIQSIKSQFFKDIEIIVVDKFSSDRTQEIALGHGVRFFKLKEERSKAKNLGTKKSKGKYICFIDSDMLLEPSVMNECLEKINESKKFGGVIIPERSIGKGFWPKIRDFERSFYFNSIIESPRFFKKQLVEEVKGFDEKIVVFEESTLPQKIEKKGYETRARIKNSVIFHNENDFSLKKWLEKKFHYGKTISEYKRKYGEYGESQISPIFRLGLFLKNRNFYSRPAYAIGVLFLKTTEFISLELGNLSSKVEKWKILK